MMRAPCRWRGSFGFRQSRPVVGWTKRHKTDFSNQNFGDKVANSEEALAQNMHQMTKGRYNYLADFWKSLNRGPVKLTYDKTNGTDAEKERDAAQSRAIVLISRAMVLGSIVCVAGCAAGWWVLKKALGVADAREFSEFMGQRLPKLKDEASVGQSLKRANEISHDSISENESLALLRRSVRGKFNTEEGARIARENSIQMAEIRAKERIARRSKSATVVMSGAPAGGPTAQESAASNDTPKLLRRLTRGLSRASSHALDSVLPESPREGGAGEARVSDAEGATVESFGATSGAAENADETVVPSLIRRITQGLAPLQRGGEVVGPGAGRRTS